MSWNLSVFIMSSTIKRSVPHLDSGRADSLVDESLFVSNEILRLIDATKKTHRIRYKRTERRDLWALGWG